MLKYCDECEIADCDLRDNVNFCEDCKEYFSCPILFPCPNGYDVECNNGFEPKDPFYEDEGEDENEEL